MNTGLKWLKETLQLFFKIFDAERNSKVRLGAVHKSIDGGGGYLWDEAKHSETARESSANIILKIWRQLLFDAIFTFRHFYFKSKTCANFTYEVNMAPYYLHTK